MDALSAKDLLAFYAGTGTDRRGRSLSQILSWNASNLERYHDYIQTLFPLPERSAVDWHAPIIDAQVFKAFRERDDLKENLEKAFKKIMWFYGFEVERVENKLVVDKGPDFNSNPKVWNHRYDHNHLRISRIIRSLRVLGLEEEAQGFWAALSKYSNGPNSRSREYWRRAAQRALNLKPDLEGIDDDELGVGPRFLREWEEEKKRRRVSVAAKEGKKDTKKDEEVEEA
ncbi:opioid growth factor receptor conserved region-domain-containing protein [Halenospora varia]|nr:opioid growth factor receptor conserved region-domain-containing protein [Halenospora varia]